jgi:hypothetical protein
VLYHQQEAHVHRYLRVVSERSLLRTYRSGIVAVHRAILQLSDAGEDGTLQSHKVFSSVLRAGGHVVSRVRARFGVRMAQDTADTRLSDQRGLSDVSRVTGYIKS